MTDYRQKLIESFKIAKDLDNKYQNANGAGIYRKFIRLRILKHKYLIYKTLSRLGFRMICPMNTFWGRRVYLPLGDTDTQFWYFYGLLTRSELALTAYMLRNFKDNDVYYDIGANYGYYSFIAQEIVTKGTIHIFEPNKDVFKFLENNFRQSKNIVLNNVAVTNILGDVNFYNSFDSNASGLSTTIEQVAIKREKDFYTSTIKAITLDHYIKTNARPTIIKIDVEGAELSVLKGSFRLLKGFNPTIAMEVWMGKNGSNNPEPAVNFLYDLGYKSFKISEDGDLHEHVIDFSSFPIGFENFIFKKSV